MARNNFRDVSPGGRFETSPAVHCRVGMRYPIRPEGTGESIECLGFVLIPRHAAAILPSLRDLLPLFDHPTLERVGYCQFSLREMATDPSVVVVQERTEKCIL